MEATIFDNAFRNFGGIYITDNSLYNRFFTRGNDYIKGINRFGEYLKPPPKVYFNYINNCNLNAKATITSNDHGLIGFNAGGFAIIYDLFLKILAHSETLKQIGNPNNEIYSSPIIRNYYSDFNRLTNFGDFNYDEYKQIIPIDDNRKAFSLLLFDIAFEFLFNHEMTHILDGHIFFIQNNKGHCNNLTFQTLEMDADCISISKILAHHVRKFKGMLEIPIGYKPFYNDINSVIFLIYYSISTLFRIIADNAVYKLNDITDLGHSKPRVRQLSIAATIHEYFNKYFVELKSELDLKMFSNVIIEIENNYKMLTGNLLEKSGYDEAFSEKAKKQNTDILENWKAIRPELIKHSYVNLV